MRVFCVLLPGGGGPPARRPRRELPARRPWSLCSLACLRVGARGRRPARSPSAPRASLGASYRSPCRELPACRPPRCKLPVRCVARCLRGLCSLACLRVGAWGRRPARSPSAPRASLGVSSRSPRCGLPARRPFGAPARRLRSLCSLACLRVGAWGRRPACSPSAPRASLGASSRSPARPCRRPQAPEPTQVHGFSFCPRLGRIVRRGEPATEQGAPTRHGLVTGSDAPRAVFAVSA